MVFIYNGHWNEGCYWFPGPVAVVEWLTQKKAAPGVPSKWPRCWNQFESCTRTTEWWTKGQTVHFALPFLGIQRYLAMENDPLIEFYRQLSHSIQTPFIADSEFPIAVFDHRRIFKVCMRHCILFRMKMLVLDNLRTSWTWRWKIRVDQFFLPSHCAEPIVFFYSGAKIHNGS